MFILSVTPVTAQNPLHLTVETEKLEYKLREKVNIYGSLNYDTQPVAGGLVAVQVRDPQKTIVARTLPVGEVAAPPGGWPIEILSATLSDYQGNPQTSVIRGGNAMFKATIKNNKTFDIRVLLTINVYDAALIPIGILAAQFTLAAGSTTTLGPANIYIESWVTSGTAPIYVNVYTDWPEAGGYPLCPEKVANYTIQESEYETPPANEIPQPIIQNGAYGAYFQLSPEPPPGNYNITASAWYQGWTTYTKTSFTVIDVTAPPRANFVVKPPMAGPNFTITFDAAPSTPEGYNDTITGYKWDFGDGANATGQTVTHSYPNIGNYTVTLNVTDAEGFWNTTSKTVVIVIIHNIAVAKIQSLKQVYDNWLAPVYVTVKNFGTVNETFNVTIYANSTMIQRQQTSNLGPLQTTTITFSWNTTGIVPYANYTIKATADILENETDTSDNNLINGSVQTMKLGDTNNNRRIDIYDVVKVTAIYGVKSSSTSWDIMADLKPDGIINIYDVVQVTSMYGYTF